VIIVFPLKQGNTKGKINIINNIFVSEHEERRVPLIKIIKTHFAFNVEENDAAPPRK
jgi:hypothetical protein